MSVNKVSFDEAFISIPVGSKKIQESEYTSRGSICVVDQGQKLVSGYTDRNDFVRKDTPYIIFGDHTRVVKYVDFPFVVGADGVRLFKASREYESDYLFLFLRSVSLPSDGYGRHSKHLKEVFVPKLEKNLQRRIAARLKEQLAEVEKARHAAEVQLAGISSLANAIIFDSVSRKASSQHLLGDVLVEVKKGVGEGWAKHPVLGATRAGLALAKEPPGKYPQKYKPVLAGTAFYNPMRILIGSIAFVDDDDTPGITSPDYVVLRGKDGVVDSRWFYYWLRSPLGEQCILSLARGAVRERMLFNRLAEGSIELPEYKTQQRASAALAALKPMRKAVEEKLQEINLLPQKILAAAFEGAAWS